MLAGDSNEYVRTDAAHTLGKIGDRAAIGALQKALTDPSQRVRSEAAAALLALGVTDAPEHPQQDAPSGVVGPTVHDTAVEL